MSCRYSKETSNPVRVVVAVAGDSDVERVEQLPQGVRVSSEYPSLTKRFFESKGIAADVRLSYGASEAKIPDIADCVVDITETGRAPAAQPGCGSSTRSSPVRPKPSPTRRRHADPDKRHAMAQLMMLLNGALEARGKVLVKLNVVRRRVRGRARRAPVRRSRRPSPISPTAGSRSRASSRRRRSTASSRPSATPGRRICSRSRSARSSIDRRDATASASRVGHRVRRVAGLGEITDETATCSRSTASRSPTARARSRSARRSLRRARQARSLRSGERSCSWTTAERRRIIDVILALGPGEVTTYGDIADVAGYPKRARLVGRILATTTLDVPWWRVVNVSRPAGSRPRARAGPALARRRRRRQRWSGQVGAAPGGSLVSRRSAAPAAALTCTNASRMLASASRIVGASSPSRSPRPSTRQATASMASAAPRRSGGSASQVDRRQLVQAHHVVGDHDLGRQLGQSSLRLAESPHGPRRAPMRRRRPPRRRRFHLPRALPYRRQLRRSGGDPHPATPTGRARQIRATGSMLMIRRRTVRRPCCKYWPADRSVSGRAPRGLRVEHRNRTGRPTHCTGVNSHSTRRTANSTVSTIASGPVRSA